VQPSGAIHRSLTIEYDDHARTITEHSPAGIVLSVRVVHDDGLTTIRLRDQSILDDGCAAMRLLWDASGAQVGTQCLDSQGKIMGDSANCASRALKRNALGDIVENNCTLPPGETADPKRILSTRFAVNDYGDTIGTQFFGAGGARVTDDSGCYGNRQSYDNGRNQITSICVDEKDQPIEGTDHVMSQRNKFDPNGCLVEKQWFAVAGLATLPAKPSVTRFTRDVHCNELSAENFDAKGLRFDSANAPAITRYRLDANFDVLSKTCQGAASEPVSCIFPADHEDHGSLLVFRRDAFGRAIADTCFMHSGTPSNCGEDMPHERRYDYDSHGQMIAQAFFDVKKQPASRLGKMHRRTFDYDDAGNITADHTFDIDDKPAVNALGFSILFYHYDDRHRLVTVESCGVDAKPVSAYFCMGAKCFPKGASKLEVVRQHGMHNVFTAPDGKLVQDVDCTQGACWE
jgi:hypothetical protein